MATFGRSLIDSHHTKRIQPASARWGKLHSYELEYSSNLRIDVLDVSQSGCSVWVTSSTELALTPNVVALGKFDGLHRGHLRVIRPILPPTSSGDETNSTPPPHKPLPLPDQHTYSTVVTFNPHPQEFFTGQPRTLLTPLDEKIQLLRSLRVEQLVLLPFNKEMCALTPEEFMTRILLEQLQAVKICVGQDFRFGVRRSGNAQDLQVLAAKYGIPVIIVPLERHTESSSIAIDGDRSESTPETRISTSLIRQTLSRGNIQEANRLLGRPYTLVGTVVKGQQLGRKIGFPTANLALPKDKFLPSLGVYAVRVFDTEETPNPTFNSCPGVMNIGNRPTIHGTHVSVEVHLFDWTGDLYGKKLVVQLEKFLRPEQKFPSLEALKAQIQQDCAIAKAFFTPSAEH